jgi:hypothetical protein
VSGRSYAEMSHERKRVSALYFLELVALGLVAQGDGIPEP